MQKVIDNNKNKGGGGTSGESEKERKAREKAEKKLKLKLASVRLKPSANRSRLLIPSRLRPISFWLKMPKLMRRVPRHTSSSWMIVSQYS